MMTTETITERIIGPYTGKRISGTSNDVVEAVITIEYRFEGFTVRVADVPARLDRVSGREYLAGPVALRINTKVNEIVETMQHKRQAGPEASCQDIPLTFHLSAPDFLSDAA